MSQVAFTRRADLPATGDDAGRVNRQAHQSSAPDTALTNALGAIVAYFPTEVNVLYTAVLAAISTGAGPAGTGQWVAFWSMLAASPVVVWLIYAARCRAYERKLPLRPRTWPRLEMVFATIAFAVWGAALPDSPFGTLDWYSPALAGDLVLVVTAALGLLAPVFATRSRRPPTGDTARPAGAPRLAA